MCKSNNKSKQKACSQSQALKLFKKKYSYNILTLKKKKKEEGKEKKRKSAFVFPTGTYVTKTRDCDSSPLDTQRENNDTRNWVKRRDTQKEKKNLANNKGRNKKIRTEGEKKREEQ